MNKVTEDILYTGVNDYTTDLFESQYPIPCGVTYNSYVILDEKILVASTTGPDFGEEWMGNVKEALNGKTPDYLLIQHMEPDHSSTIAGFMEEYPNAVIAASKQAMTMIANFFGTDYSGRSLVLKEGDTLNLGRHELVFVAAPMVHWPEVMLAYDKTDKVLFSADAFGRFGAPKNPACDAACEKFEEAPWLDEARRYYAGIVGKHGGPVKNALAKAKDLDIRIICPLHGPVLTHDLARYFDVYSCWAEYMPEEKGFAICYSSVYGHTKEAAQLLSKTLKELYKAKGHCERENRDELSVEIFDLARCDLAEAVAAAFRYDKVVLATTTYNNDIFPCMRGFIDHLKYSAFQKRTVALMENGSWAPRAALVMKELLKDCPDLTFAENVVTIKSALNDASRQKITQLALELLNIE